jgi:hypothetical protein
VSTVELRRRRDAGEMIGDAIRLWSGEAGRLLAIGAIIAIPANLIVSGIGLEQLWSDYDTSTNAAAAVIPTVLDYLVTLPLIIAMTVSLLTTPGGSRSVGRAASAGLDAYRAIFGVVLLALLGVAGGLLLLIIPGIYLAIRWYFGTWAVVIEGARGSEALRRSGELVQGNWWRVFGVLLLTNLVALVPIIVVYVPFGIAAAVADAGAFDLAGRAIGAAVAYPYMATVGTLLYFDLIARKQTPATPPDPPGLPPRE